MSTLTALPIN